jgi:hypothetical protein
MIIELNLTQSTCSTIRQFYSWDILWSHETILLSQQFKFNLFLSSRDFLQNICDTEEEDHWSIDTLLFEEIQTDSFSLI